MANSTDKSILTAAGKALLAQLNAEEKALVIDKMIFANVPNRPEYPQPDDVVPTDHIVHQEQVEQRGRLSADSVIYSTTLTSDVGPFDFNWTGVYCSEYGVLVTIDHHALTPKTADEPGVAGNTLVRSVVLEYKDIAEITNITVDASSWQYNATERMKKMDSDVAQSIIDQNGKDWFIEDGFLVTPSGSAYSIKAGAGYVSGNRVAMEFDRSVQVPNKPSFIYIDAHREGTPTGEQVTLFNFVVTAEEKDDYVDSSTGKDIPHYVCKIAQVHADGSVSDLRPDGEVLTKKKLWRDNGDCRGWDILADGTDETIKFKKALTEYPGIIKLQSGKKYIVNDLDVTPRLESDMTNKATLICNKEGAAIFLNKKPQTEPFVGIWLKDINLDTDKDNCRAYKALYEYGYSYTDSARFTRVNTSVRFRVSYDGNFIFSHWKECTDGIIGKQIGFEHQFLTATQYGQVNANKFEKCRIYRGGNGNNKLKPIEATWANGNDFINCNFEYCFGGIMKLTGGYSNIFDKCWFEVGNEETVEGALLPSEWFELEQYELESQNVQVRSFLLKNCVLAIGTIEKPFGLQDGGAIFKSTSGAGGEWGLIDCTFWGSRPEKLKLYEGPHGDSIITWNNISNAGGVDTSESFIDFRQSAKIMGQRSNEFNPKFEVINTGEKANMIKSVGNYVIDSEQVNLMFDVEWDGLPNTGVFQCGITLPSNIRDSRYDSFVNIMRLEGLVGVPENWIVFGEIKAGEKYIRLYIKANDSSQYSSMSPQHCQSGRLTGHVVFTI